MKPAMVFIGFASFRTSGLWVKAQQKEGPMLQTRGPAQHFVRILEAPAYSASIIIDRKRKWLMSLHDSICVRGLVAHPSHHKSMDVAIDFIGRSENHSM